jgi:molybdopterin synthase catalytic subunit/molybdopterin converting factor small subunit
VRIRVRLFALQRQQLGRRELELELPASASVGQAWDRLVAEHPVLEPATASVRFARNGVYAEPADALREGDEMAVIPPVAGGGTSGGGRSGGGTNAEAPSGGESGRRRHLALTGEPIDDTLLADLRCRVASPDDGAVVCFVGQTRRTPGTPAPGQEAMAPSSGEVLELEYEAFESMAQTVLGQIAQEIEERFGVAGLAVVHRTGTVPVGEPSVAICAAAPHRAAAFDACRYAIEELKARAPIWKAERFADGAVWLGEPARSAAAGSRLPERAGSRPLEGS